MVNYYIVSWRGASGKVFLIRFIFLKRRCIRCQWIICKCKHEEFVLKFKFLKKLLLHMNYVVTALFNKD